MRTRNHNWYDAVKGRPLYGFQIRHEKHGWLNASTKPKEER